MHCFGIEWLEQLLICIVIVCAVVALLELLVSFVLPRIGLAGEIVSFIVAAVRIIIWAIICIFAIYFIFELISCVLGSGLGVPRLH